MSESTAEAPESISIDVRDYTERGQPTIEFSAHKDYDKKSFLQFVSEAPSEQLLAYFRAVLYELEGKRKLEEYHLKVFAQLRRGSEGWGIKVFHGEASNDKDGPLDAQQCMSCEMDCPLSVGVGAGDTSLCSKDTLIQVFEHHNAWIDAKARPLLVLTPKRHVRRLADLSDVELEAFWRNAGELLTANNLPGFTSAILNHGKFQNHAHLHLKIRIHPDIFSECVGSWCEERRATYQRLKRWVASLPYEKRGIGPMRKRQAPEPCRNFSRGQCRYGSNCRFSHDSHQMSRAYQHQGR
mmetsp:Transcript_20447/g.44751  ORF Transcript_20447/g.44751 Transcript_20447/m.44751 type:complete len:296 (+) Transcript_20447:304-1191(+)